MLYREITEKIIGAAMNIYTILGFGFMEKVYENTLMIERELLGLKTIQQYSIKLFYKGNIGGDYVADIIVED